MHMKAAHGDDTGARKLPGPRRAHIITKLHMAAKEAHALAGCLEQKDVTNSSTADFLEAKAYACSLKGAEEFEKRSTNPKSKGEKSWKTCLENFAAARTIYQALLNAREKRDVIKDCISRYIDPSIRVAAYQSRIPRTVAIDVVAQKYFKGPPALVGAIEEVDPSAFQEAKTSEQQGFPTTITWRGTRKANLVDASIGQALAAVYRAEEQLSKRFATDRKDMISKDKAAAYDDVLICCQDAVDATRHAIEEHEKEKVPEADPRMQDLRVTNLAVNYKLIGWRVGRNRVLIGDDDGLGLTNSHQYLKRKRDGTEQELIEPRSRKLARLREEVALYNAILQSVESVKDLRGAVRDPTFVQELDGQIAYFKALK